jgi:hypothetical protein
LLLEGLDGWDGVARLNTLLIFVYFPADDCLCGLGLAAAVCEVGGGDLLEIVDVVNEATFDLVHAGVDVTGDGDVDEEHGAVAAAVQEVLTVGASEDLLRGSGTGDNDVGAIGLLVKRVEGDDCSGDRGVEEFGSELFGAGLSSIGDEDAGCSVLDEMAGGEFGHLAGAYEENGFPLERTEDLSSQVNGYRGDGDRA